MRRRRSRRPTRHWAGVAAALLPALVARPLWAESTPASTGVSLQAIAAAAFDADVTLRLQAATLAGNDASARGLTLLYILAHDVDGRVQAAAFAAVLRRCGRESTGVCADMVQFFVGDAGDSETHWQARDWLLLEAPRAATADASLNYKLDVVARMGERVDQPRCNTGVLQILRLLAEDPEPEVQEAAAAVLLRAKL